MPRNDACVAGIGASQCAAAAAGPFTARSVYDGAGKRKGAVEGSAEAERLQRCHRLRAHQITARFVAREPLAVEQHHPPAAACQQERRRAAGRTGADDDDVRDAREGLGYRTSGILCMRKAPARSSCTASS